MSLSGRERLHPGGRVPTGWSLDPVGLRQASPGPRRGLPFGEGSAPRRGTSFHVGSR